MFNLLTEKTKIKHTASSTLNTSILITQALDKSAYLKIVFLISQPKLMLWAPKTYV